jgi:hypothetical protein
LGASILLWSKVHEAGNARAAAWLGFLPLVPVAICALLGVRGYVVTPDEIQIRRPLWSTNLPRAGLQSATVDHDALRGSIRLFGIGGLFSFTGLFRSPRLGRYRAFVTDPGRTVILRFADRVVVVSPADPQAFIRDLSPRH